MAMKRRNVARAEVFTKIFTKIFPQQWEWQPKGKKSGCLGQADLVLSFLEKTYVIELKMATNKDALGAATKGLEQIRLKNYGGAFKNPILLSLGLDKDLRIATACVFALGNMEGRLIADQNGEIYSVSQVETGQI
jgi:hypothetical protein